MIAGKINMPAGQMRGTAVFAHCFTCSKDSLAAVRIAQNLAAAGIAVLRFDFTGLGQSEGAFATSGFAGNLDDLEDACLWLGDELVLPEILIGHSLGGRLFWRWLIGLPLSVGWLLFAPLHRHPMSCI